MTDSNASIASAAIEGAAVTVRWLTAATMTCHSMWLRDQCGCAECRHEQTGQRTLSVLDISPDVEPAEVSFTADKLTVVWNDGHQSRYSSSWLHAQTQGSRTARRHRATLWNRDFRRAVPRVEYDGVVSSDVERFDLLKALLDHGLAFVDAVPVTPEATESLAEFVGFIRETPHGRVYDIRSLPDVDNIAYTSVALSLHTDASYHYEPPGVVLFHCLEADAIGGETVLVDGFEVAEVLRTEDPEAFSLLTRVPWQYSVSEPGVDLRSESPVIGLTARGDYDRIVFNEYNASPCHLDVEQMASAYRSWRLFAEICSRPELQLRFKMRTGEALMFDNRRVLHARTAFEPGTGGRWLRSCYLDRDAFHNNLRLLARRLRHPLADAVFTTI